MENRDRRSRLARRGRGRTFYERARKDAIDDMKSMVEDDANAAHLGNA